MPLKLKINKIKSKTLKKKYKSKKKYTAKKNLKKKYKKRKITKKKGGGGKPSESKTEPQVSETQLSSDSELSKSAVAVASVTPDSNMGVAGSFVKGLSEQYGPEIDELKKKLKGKLDTAASIIKDLSSQSEDWNSPENKENIRLLKENTLKQIDDIGLPVAVGVAKVAGSSAGTVVKEIMMTSGISEVIAALRLELTTVSTLIDLANKLGLTEKLAPLIGVTIGKISDIIGKANISNENTQFQVETGDEVTRTVTDQNIAVTNTETGLTKDIKVEKSQEGNNFSVK